MNRTIARFVAPALLSLWPSVAAADFESKRVGEDIYYVFFKRSARISGGMFDTDEKARKKLEKHTRKLCRSEGYRFVRYPTMRAVREEYKLRDAWQEATGKLPTESTEVRRRGKFGGPVTTHHSHQRLVVFAKEARPEYEACR